MQMYFWGHFKKSTISFRSSFSSISPATLLKEISVLWLSRARLLPKFIIRELFPPAAPARMFITKIARTTPPTARLMGRMISVHIPV